MFAKKKFREALDSFNKSVLKGPFTGPSGQTGSEGPDDFQASEELVLALGNRSAALHFIKKFELSIRDIDLAFQWGYPEEQRYKLWDRRGKCMAQLGRKDEAIESFQRGITSLGKAKLDKDGLPLWLKNFDKQMKKVKSAGDAQHAKIRKGVALDKETIPDLIRRKSQLLESANEDLGLTKDENLGRQVYALNDISVGDVVAMEKSWSDVVYTSSSTVVCDHCLVTTEAPIPCHNCSDVGFCSSSCRNQGWEATHYVECKYMGYFSEFWITKIGHLGLMTTVKAGYKTLREYFGTNRAQNINRDDIESGYTDGMYKNNYHALFHMATNNNMRLPDVLMSFGLMAILMLEVLRDSSQFWEEAKEIADTPEEMDRIVATSIMHHMQVVQCNAFTTTTVNMAADFRECRTVDTGLGIFPTLGLINHSCDPNLDCYNYGNTMILRAARDINRGEPMYVSYGMNYYTYEKKVRKMYYMTQFYFNCQCIACTNDWPLWDDIECRIPVFKCDQCDTNLPTTQPLVIDCPKCNRIMDIGEVLYRLEKSHECFSLAMDDVMKWRLDTALPILEEHLRLMQMYLKSPWRETVTCQATVQQIYNIFCHRFQNFIA